LVLLIETPVSGFQILNRIKMKRQFKNNVTAAINIFMGLSFVLIIIATAGSCKTEKKPAGPLESEPLEVADEMPQFPGGDSMLLAFIGSNTVYPEEAKKSGTQGRVLVRFCVTEKGNVERVSILKGVNPELDAESVRVVKTLPPFTPGRQDGKEVSVWYALPITFKLQ
jgi:TonB family protein